ncbi:MAG: TonB-dependent receptor [Bacteroidia bacterium]
MIKRTSILFLFLCTPMFLFAQNATQKIHGTVTDAQSESPLPGVIVKVLNSDSLIGTATDADGRYVLTNVHIGHVSLGFSLMGYKTVVLNNIVLDAGKEGSVNVTMEEYVDTLKEVVIHTGKDKQNALNEMTTASAGQFSPDDASRYAGALSDPSRMATNFAGVGVANDSRNDIVIRGNSPLGLLWMLDGVDIPNPNHFGTLGSTGGPVSILNNNMLDQSDFMTGAFPAEYGNAVAGVFDLQMKNGNSEKSEFAGEIGFNGAELQAEGPFSQNSQASYIIDYRYSTLAVFQFLGINYGFAAVPQYQDISFKINIPMGVKYGTISIFGLGGPSYIALLADQQDNYSVTPFNENTYFNSNMGAVGASYKLFFNENTSQTISLAVSGLQNITKIDTNDNGNYKITFGQNATDIITALSYTFNKKIDTRNTVKTGVKADIYNSDYGDSVLVDNAYIYGNNFKATNTLLQAYMEWQHKFTDNIVLNSGLHYQYFSINNNSKAFEPRIGIKWHFAPKQSIALATGMHSEMQPISVYYYENQLPNGTYAETNTGLGFSKSAHIVLAYDYAFLPGWRMKVETYYQYLYNIPVQIQPNTYSTLNIGASYYDPPYDSLVNKGTGQNYGAELTIEKFFDKTYYVLLTSSLYQSQYKGSDGVLRNTAFDGNYTLNALAGGDINLDKQKRKVISISAKINYAGGKRYIPIDLAASQVEHVPIYEYSDAYVDRYPDYSRVDLKIGFKLNSKKITQEWAFEAQNIFNRQNIFEQIYNPDTNSLQTDYQLGFFPVGSYKITF